MATTLLVTYDLNREGRSSFDYDKWYKIRDTYDWVRLSESSYAIYTNDTVQTVYDKFRACMDSNDYVYIITLKRPYLGYGPNQTNAWLEKRLTH